MQSPHVTMTLLQLRIAVSSSVIIILSPALVNVAFITSSGLDMITAESGADTLNRNLFLRQRFAFARQRFHRTIALLGSPRLHIPITENAVARSRSAGHRGLLRRRQGKKNLILSLLNPLIR